MRTPQEMQRRGMIFCTQMREDMTTPLGKDHGTLPTKKVYKEVIERVTFPSTSRFFKFYHGLTFILITSHSLTLTYIYSTCFLERPCSSFTPEECQPWPSGALA